jgi:hypothetical protein
MEARSAATGLPDPDAADFIRFCYRRRRVGWPELYDEMCAVAARGLFRGLCADDLAEHGIGFALFDMPALAAMTSGIIAEEQALRRPVVVMITPIEPIEPIEPVVGDAEPVAATDAVEPSQRGERPVRLSPVTAGA